MSKAKSSPQPTGNRLYLGIDLGTSRSAVCGSNGQRSWVSSYVGWPKDFVARKALGAPVLFGEQATKSRLSLNLHRPLEHGVIKEGGKDEEAVGLDGVPCGEGLVGHGGFPVIICRGWFCGR